MPRILTVQFPTNALAWSISPEPSTEQKKFLDLLVTHNTFNPIQQMWTIIYEGKSKNSSDNAGAILTQLVGYGEAHVTQAGKFIYLIGAKGKKCWFYRFKKGDLIETTSMSLSATGAVLFKDSGLALEFDIQTDQNTIVLLLGYIFNNPPT
jgi:hypothetical protein